MKADVCWWGAKAAWICAVPRAARHLPDEEGGLDLRLGWTNLPRRRNLFRYRGQNFAANTRNSTAKHVCRGGRSRHITVHHGQEAVGAAVF